MAEQTPEIAPGVPFAMVTAKRCSNPAHIVWDVTYVDGTPDHLHQGLWPIGLNPRRHQQLDAAVDSLRRREARKLAALTEGGDRG